MPLILQVTTYRNQPLASALSCVFSAAGGTLGRAVGNDLVLDDPGKFISRTHARIELRAGQYFLTDTGSNPSVINDRPLGNGREILLNDGDCILIGDYRIEVSIQADVYVSHAPVNDAEQTSTSQPDGQALPLFVPPPAPVPAPLPPLEAPAVQRSDAGVIAPGVAPDALAGARILESGSVLDAHEPLADPLGLNLFGGGAVAALPTLDAPREDRLMPAFRGAENDHLAPELQAFTLPSAPVQAAPIQAAPIQAALAPEPMMIPADYDPLADFLPPVVTVVELAPAPVAPVPVELVEPIVVQSPPVVPEPVKATSPADGAVLQALLKGLGLPHLNYSRSPVELAQLVGEMLREATGGTMDVLMARALTKRESHIDMTMIGPRSNNPLKFFPDANSALSQMLTAQSPAYLTPVQAMAAAFDDLKAHEMAVIAGMRAALDAVVQRFDPARIEQRLAQPGTFDRLMPATRKARMWDRLVELYGDLARDADEDLQRLFGEKFSIAYEQQVARLRGER